MDGVPQRPALVPADAIWVQAAGEWREGAVDGQGARQGLHRSWRRDGTLRDEVTFVDDKAEGRYRRLHPNGQLAGEGEFAGGEMQGTLIACASDAPTPELLQPCCVPPNAWQLQTDYDHGQVTGRRWYDRLGTQILENGQPRPPRPEVVPAEARYDESAGAWVTGALDARAARTGRWRRWSTGGVLLDEEELASGVRHGVWRAFHPDSGALQVECHYVQGLREGPCRDLRLAGDDYQDPRAAAEEGTFERDQATGVWTLRDAAGAIIAERDLGLAVGEEGLARSPALADDPNPQGVGGLADLSATLRGARRIGESIIAAARGAALAGDARPLLDLLAQATWPRSAAAAAEIAAAAIKGAGESLAPLVSALVRGGDAPALLRALASSVKGAHRAALQLIDAALLLAPDRSAGYVTRALINLHLGAPEAARADVQRLPADGEEQRTLLFDYTRVLFPTFDFWPARIAVETLFQEFPAAPAQPLDAMRATIQKYATRIGLLRAALVAQLGAPAREREPAWLPPALPELLPDGPVALGAWRFQQNIPGETPDAPAETQEVAVDERLSLEGQTIPALLRLARRDWAALCWLCWSSGLDRVALPSEAASPASFGQAAGMSVERAWRCRDKLTSGGLVALAKRVPGFEWEGIHIDLMPRALAEIMAEEQTDVRALFCWLCDPEAQSPWQEDLRDGD